jgi:hypothetical protein
MRNSKRTQNKKRVSQVKRSRKQRGSSDPDKKKRTKNFTVYYNYTIRDTNGEILTRRLNRNELGVCRDWMIETRDIIIADHAPQFANLQVGLLEQLEEPYDGYRFSLLIIVTDKSNEQAINLIRDYMDETAADYITFDWPHRPTHISDDQNRYLNTTQEEIRIEEVQLIGGSQKQRGAKPPKIQ